MICYFEKQLEIYYSNEWKTACVWICMYMFVYVYLYVVRVCVYVGATSLITPGMSLPLLWISVLVIHCMWFIHLLLSIESFWCCYISCNCLVLKIVNKINCWTRYFCLWQNLWALLVNVKNIKEIKMKCLCYKKVIYSSVIGLLMEIYLLQWLMNTSDRFIKKLYNHKSHTCEWHSYTELI